MHKTERQKAMSEIIAENTISRQEVLAKLLTDRGFSATQSSISRDLNNLGIVKINGNYALPTKTRDVIDLGVLNLTSAGENLIVAKTESGLASAVCVKIDNAEIGEIAGTIAGEDTIFIAVKNFADQQIASKKIREIFDNGEW